VVGRFPPAHCILKKGTHRGSGALRGFLLAHTRRLNECEPARSGELVGVRHVSFFGRCEHSRTRRRAVLVLSALSGGRREDASLLLLKQLCTLELGKSLTLHHYSRKNTHFSQRCISPPDARIRYRQTKLLRRGL
jgi:hypothetical protein